MKTSALSCLGIVLSLTLAVRASALKPAAEPLEALVKVPIASEASLRARGIRIFPDHFSHPVFRVGYVDKAVLARLPKTVRAEIEVLDDRRWMLGGYDRETLHERPVEARHFETGYHDYEALTRELQSIRDQYPTFVRLETAGQSVQGRELWYLVISQNVGEEKHKPKIIYHANMHGDEVVGRELMLLLSRHLLENFGKDQRITQIVSNAELYVMPSMNPDGYELQRRSNANGVDLNRNFPDRFEDPSDTPEGREIEVQRMMGLARKNHFVYGINWHGGEITFNLPWGDISNEHDEDKYGDDWFLYPIGREYTEHNGPMHDNHHDNFDHGLTYGYEWYPVNGGIDDWFNFYRRSVHAVVELSTVKWPSASKLPRFWDDNREAMLTHLWRGLRGVHLDVRDGSGKSVASPTVELSASPKRPLAFDDGFIHRLTGDGTQQVTVKAIGFKPKTLAVPATYFDGSFTPVTLDPL